jgi:hypothetical protein
MNKKQRAKKKNQQNQDRLTQPSSSIEDAQKNATRLSDQLTRKQNNAAAMTAQNQANDIALMRQQYDLQNTSTAQQQSIYNSSLDYQNQQLGQYNTNFAAQLANMQQSNTLLQNQGNLNSAYQDQTRALAQRVQQLQGGELKRASENTKYAGMVQSLESKKNAGVANSLLQQLNRRRAQRALGTTGRTPVPVRQRVQSNANKRQNQATYNARVGVRNDKTFRKI